MGIDHFLPSFDIREVRGIAISAACEEVWPHVHAMDLEAVPLVKAIIRAREWILGAQQKAAAPQTGDFFSRMAALGWGYLSTETPPSAAAQYIAKGIAKSVVRGIVMGAITKPWEADVVFHPLPPDEFSAFPQPGWVKIAWEIRVEPRGNECYVQTDTRALATDEASRQRFRRYWFWVSPGVKLIRWAALRDLRRRALGGT